MTLSCDSVNVICSPLDEQSSNARPANATPHSRRGAASYGGSVPADDDAQAEILRKFAAAIAGARIGRPAQPRRPSRAGQSGTNAGGSAGLRRPPLKKVARLCIRADLDVAPTHLAAAGTAIRPDPRHRSPVLQTAFDWADSHLHRFSLGGGPFDAHSQLFLCPTTPKSATTTAPPRRRFVSTKPCKNPATSCTTSMTTATLGAHPAPRGRRACRAGEPLGADCRRPTCGTTGGLRRHH